MTDWSITHMNEGRESKYSPQNVYDNIKGGNDIMMPGSQIDYDILLQKFSEKYLSRDDLLRCSSKVYETVEMLNKK